MERESVVKYLLRRAITSIFVQFLDVENPRVLGQDSDVTLNQNKAKPHLVHQGTVEQLLRIYG